MGVSRWTIYRNVVQGIIPAKRLSQRTTLIRKKDIETLFDVIEPYEVLVTGERKLIDEWYTIDEITEKYGLLRHRIRKIINAEGIPTKKAGTRTLIAKNKIDTYFKKKGFDTTLSNLADWITTVEVMESYNMTEHSVRVFVSRYAIPKMENPLKVVPLIHSNLTPVKFSHSPFCLFLFSSYSSCPLCRVLH